MDDIGKNIVSWGGNALALLASVVQENEIVQWIMFGLGIVGSVLSILVSVMRIVSKWKSVSSDGKITPEEWDAALAALDETGLSDGYVQELSASGEEEIPAFDGTGVIS